MLNVKSLAHLAKLFIPNSDSIAMNMRLLGKIFDVILLLSKFLSFCSTYLYLNIKC